MAALAVKRLTKNALRGPSSALKWISNRSNGSPHHVWQKKLRTEVNFWDRWLATGGLTLFQEEFRKRTGVKTEVEPDIARFLRSKDDRILDVGSGPLTVIGSMWKGNRLDITAVDPLADEYNVLLDKHGILPPVRTRKADAAARVNDFETGAREIY